MTGQFPHNIDAKSRLFIPAKLREELGDVFHVTIGQDGCLWVFSDADWNAFMEDLKSQPYSKVKRLRPLFAYSSASFFASASVTAAQLAAAIFSKVG